MSRVSVIVLAYERPAYLAEALESIAQQTRAPDEVLVVDDHSSPPLEDRVTVPDGVACTFLRQERNSGPAAGAAAGLRAATGSFVAFLNDDDVWAPRFVEKLAQALEASPGSGMAFCDHGVIRPDGTPDDAQADRISARYRRADLPEGPVADFVQVALIDQAVGAHSFAMSRRESLDPRIVGAGGDVWDYFVCLSTATRGYSGTYVDSRLGAYRASETGISAAWREPDRQIGFATRRLAAEALVLRSDALKLAHPRAWRRAARFFASGVKTALRARSARLLVWHVRRSAEALLSPTRIAPRPGARPLAAGGPGQRISGG